MSTYVENLYGAANQQYDNALIPSVKNMNWGNLIQPLKGGRSKRVKRHKRTGGNLSSMIPALTLLTAQQLYGKKSHRRSRHRFKRSRRIR